MQLGEQPRCKCQSTRALQNQIHVTIGQIITDACSRVLNNFVRGMCQRLCKYVADAPILMICPDFSN